MEFTEILNPKTIVTHLDAGSKSEVLSAMADLLVAAGIVNNKELYTKVTSLSFTAFSSNVGR